MVIYGSMNKPSYSVCETCTRTGSEDDDTILLGFSAVYSSADANISEKHTVSSFRAEVASPPRRTVL
jgi:hypothetical protein